VLICWAGRSYTRICLQCVYLVLRGNFPSMWFFLVSSQSTLWLILIVCAVQELSTYMFVCGARSKYALASFVYCAVQELSIYMFVCGARSKYTLASFVYCAVQELSIYMFVCGARSKYTLADPICLRC